MNRFRLLTVLAAAVLAAAFPLGANAGVITDFTSRGAFPGNDSLDWGQLGPDFTSITAPFSATSVGGLTIHVTQPGNFPFNRVDEGKSWTGIFTVGEHLLSNLSTGEMDFSQTPIAGFGTAIQGSISGPSTATLSAFDGATLLGSLTVSGNNTFAEDGTAPFAGVTDSVAEITSIVITNTGGDGSLGVNDFAIDSLSLLTARVPEPASWLLLSSALLGFGVVRRRNRNA
jgi:hypothetical protein